MTQRDYIKEEEEQLDSDRKAGVEGLPPIIEEKVAEYAERATIVYANFTGRDEKHRAQFRQEMLNLYRTALLEADQAGYARAMGEAKVDENTSDGYHTFKELYEFRKVFNAALFNEWAKQGKYSVHKSTRHGDGELAFGGGWFIVMATLPSGQISNHYEMKDFDLFQCEEREKADEWDGHTAQDVLTRLSSLTPTDNNKQS